MKFRWLILSLVHPAISVCFLALGHLLPAGRITGGIGYLASLLAFLINLPGVFLIQPFYTSSGSDSIGTTSFIFAMMLFLTWILVIAPLCYFISRIYCRYRKSEQSGPDNPRPSGTSGTADAGASAPPEASGGI